MPMERSDEGVWSITVEMNPGEYGYKFVVDEEWIADPENPEQRIVDGVVNSLVVVTDEGRQGEGGVQTQAEPGQTHTADEPKASEPQGEDEASNGRAAGESGGSKGSPFNASAAPGQIHEASAPMPHAIPFLFGKGGYDPARQAESMRIGIALPEKFDPGQASMKVALVLASGDGDASNVSAMRQYYRTVTRKGWVCLAVDVEGNPAKVKAWASLDLRYLLVFNAVKEMHGAWPASKDWRMATLGFAGGGGYANYVAARLVADGFTVCGIWNGGSGYTDSHFIAKLQPSPAYYAARYFLSSGKSDQVATPEVVAKAEVWARAKFALFRHETFDGGHRIWLPHVQEALEWFAGSDSQD